MTGKRFKFVCDDENCFFKDNGKVLYCYEVVELLNDLNDENEQLKREVKRLDDLWGEKCVREYLTVCGESILEEMHKEKYGDKE